MECLASCIHGIPSTSGRLLAPGNFRCTNKFHPHGFLQKPIFRRARRFFAANAGSGKPEWVRELEEHAQYDEEVMRLLQGTDGDPDRIQSKVFLPAELSALFECISVEKYALSAQRQSTPFCKPPGKMFMRIALVISCPVCTQAQCMRLPCCLLSCCHCTSTYVQHSGSTP